MNDRALRVLRPRHAVLAICGGGNAGHALAIVASRNFSGEIRWLTSSKEKADIVHRGVFSRDGLRSTGILIGTADKVRTVSSDPAEVIPDADIVLIAVPAFARGAVLRGISPYLKDSALVGSLPTRGGFEFEAAERIPGIEPNGDRVIFGLQTLPWSTRVQDPGKIVNFGALKAKVLMATLPRRRSRGLAAQLSELFGTEIVPTDNFLNMTLGNPGQIVHPGLMYGLFAEWDGQNYREDDFPFVYRKVSDQTATFIEQLSREIIAVAKKVESESLGALNLSGVLSIHEWLRISYSAQTKDTATVAACFRTGPFQSRKAPMVEITPGCFKPDFKYRYLSEDVPFGLAIVKAIAQMTEVETPGIDTVVRWTQGKLGKQYLLHELDGPDVGELSIPQNYGLETLQDLINWYDVALRPQLRLDEKKVLVTTAASRG